MDEQPTVASGDDADPDDAGSVDRQDELPSVVEDDSPAGEIIDLPWDDDLPVALGEETVLFADAEAEEDQGEPADSDLDADAADGVPARGGPPADDDDAGSDGIADEEDFDYPSEDEVDDGHGGRRARPHRVDTWRSRTATGAIATAIAMGLQQVFEPEQRRPAAVAEAPSDPYDEFDPITVDYVPDDAPATTVHVKPWLLQKGE